MEATRVLQFLGSFATILHEGLEYVEVLKGSGVFEAPHKHADHFVEVGFAKDFAPDMAAAKVLLEAEKLGAAKLTKNSYK